ncbi:MAG: beta-propeller domain-containing protein [Labilithrix sp.]|nr:beta-propeller domain-containing protein [Labilithrix sp.]MCW5812750.1 beta-propeller domain-containing protein [Labilithrix sp.]
MTIKTAFVVLAAITSAAAVGCGGGGSNGSTNTGTIRASLHRAQNCTDLLSDLKADAKYKLDKALDYSIRGIRECQKRYPDSQCAYYGGYGYPMRGGVSFGGTDDMGRAESAPTSGGAPPPAAGAPGSSSSSTSSSSGSSGSMSNSAGDAKAESPGASSYSETNTQVKGVDEADIVKNDGKNLYILHGSQFKVVQAFPATEMKDAGTFDIEGSPTEMFVADGKVVVYSQVNGAKVFAAAGVAKRAQYNEFGYYGGGSSASTDAARPYPGDPGSPETPEVYIPLTKITVLNLQGTTPVLARESYYEGGYLDSRRVGSSVRTVFQGYNYGPPLKHSVYDILPQPTSPPYDPNTGGDIKGNGEIPTQDPSPKTGADMIAAIEKLRATNHGIIDASVIGDWLPYTFVKNGDAVSANTTACEDFYVPTVGSTESGITEVSTFDLNDPAGTPRATAILGRADTVYGNADTMYLAAHAWVELPFAWYDDGDVAIGGGTDGWSGSSSGGSGSPGNPGNAGGDTIEPAPAPTPPQPTPGGIGTKTLRPRTDQAAPQAFPYSQSNTHVHKFEFQSDAKFANYVASGTVRGTVKDQFSLDDKDGILRLASHEQRTYVTADGRYAHADGSVIPKGSPPPARPAMVNHLFTLEQKGPWLETIGDGGDLAPNEQIYSVRFVEHRGYVVTFRQVDPLFVFDLSNPSKPNKLGELTIPGFSTYMHPLGSTHLLTIGRDASPEGRVQALQLKIFDVTDGANPRTAWELTYTGSEYGSSDAEHDHKAFTYFPQADGTGYLALPFYSYGYDPNDPYGGMKSTLEIFHVNTASGIKKLGAIDASTLVKDRQNGYCGGYYGPSVRRGVFLDSTVYAISYGGIAAKDIKALDAPALTLPLSTPKANDYYGRPVPACDAVPTPQDF